MKYTSSRFLCFFWVTIIIFSAFLVKPVFAWMDPEIHFKEISFKTTIPNIGDVEIIVVTNYENSSTYSDIFEWQSKRNPVITSITIKTKDNIIHVPKEAFEDIKKPVLYSFGLGYMPQSIYMEDGGFIIYFNFETITYKQSYQENLARILVSKNKVQARMISQGYESKLDSVPSKCFTDEYPFKIFCEGGPRTKTEQAKFVMFYLKGALYQYRALNGMYPTAQQGLNALIQKPTIEPIPEHWSENLYNIETDRFPGYEGNTEKPADPWGNDFIYSVSGDDFKIISLGADGKKGGTDIDADLILEGHFKDFEEYF